MNPSFDPELGDDYPYDSGTGGFQQQAWVITYLDTFTLLLGFFIILSGLGQYNFFTRDTINQGTEWPDRDIIEDWDNVELVRLYHDLSYLFRSEIQQNQVQITLNPTEIRLSFPGRSFFNSGRADLLPSGRKLIEATLINFKTLGADGFYVDIEGHTDGLPIARQAQTLFPSNWELSAARAANIVRFFLELGYPAVRLKASGYANTFPLAPDFDDKGFPIPFNNDLNRRIVFRLHLNNTSVSSL